MSAAYTCTRCGTAISGATLAGLCPRCLLQAAASHPAFRGSSATRDHQAEAERIAPRVLGDYELLEELGRGGMGVVYKARQISLNRTVALKIILSGPIASPEALERFHAEAEAAANLRHVHLVTIFDYGEWEGVPFFTMEYIEGRTLGETIGDCGWRIGDFESGSDDRGGSGLRAPAGSAASRAARQSGFWRSVLTGGVW